MREVSFVIFAVTAAVSVIPTEVFHYGIGGVPCHLHHQRRTHS